MAPRGTAFEGRFPGVGPRAEEARCTAPIALHELQMGKPSEAWHPQEFFLPSQLPVRSHGPRGDLEETCQRYIQRLGLWLHAAGRNLPVYLVPASSTIWNLIEHSSEIAR